MASDILVKIGPDSGYHWFSAKPLPETMLTECHFDPKEQTPVNFDSKYNIFLVKVLTMNVVSWIS